MSGRPARPLEQLPRLCLSVEEAARVLSISRDTFEREVVLEIRTVRLGRRRLIPVRELERWIERHALRAADDLR